MLTGFNYHGPDGQIVGDHDFGSISVVGRSPLVLDYEISRRPSTPTASPSPATTWCWRGRRSPVGSPAFDAASRAGYTDIATVDCAPGQKKARVSFAQDRAFVDYGQLFDATSMMPSHVIADELGLGDGGVTTALLNNDGPAVERIAQVWNNTWNLTPGPRSQTVPVLGPLQARLGHRATARSCWSPTTSGGAPSRSPPRSTVWPRSADLQDRVNEGAYDVVDIAAGSSGTLNLPDDYTRTDSPSAGIEQLIFAPQGPLGAVRRAPRARAVHAA